MQGLLLISGRAWCDFFVFHPELTPFLMRIEPDLKYQEKMAECFLLLLQEIKRIESCVKRQGHELVSVGTRKDNVKFDGE